MVDPEFSNNHMDHGEKAMANYWATIQQACNKWDAIGGRSLLARRAAQMLSVKYGHGSPAHLFIVYFTDTWSLFVQMVQNVERQDNNDVEFKFLHGLTRIESCEKWTGCRLALAKTKDGVYNPNTPVSTTIEGRPDGNKRAKAARDSAAAAEWLHSSIEVEQCITDSRSHSAKREEKFEARWEGPSQTNVVAKKRNTDLAFLTERDLAEHCNCAHNVYT
ncbi:methionyl-trna synthetase [Hordeum vulgare]|nr:methionyl-trna synthetase [Hordeum vulgare]